MSEKTVSQFNRGIAIALSILLAFSLLGTAPAAYAAEAEESAPASVSEVASQPAETEETAQAADPDQALDADQFGEVAELDQPSRLQADETVDPSDSEEPVEPEEPKPLAFKSSKITKALGSKAFTNELVNKESVDGKISFASSNKKVATVDSAGKVTLKDIGTATISAAYKMVGSSANQTIKYALAVNPKPVSISRVQGAVKGFSVTWTKLSKTYADGYRIYYATNSSMKNYKKVTVKDRSTAFRLITGLKNGKKYYVKVRSYKKVGGKNYYSAMSPVKTITTGLNSGDKKLDSYINKLLSSKKLKSGSSSTRLKACFKYVRGMSYRTISGKPKGSWKKWSISYAKQMYQRKSGNCYRYAALYCWLARGLGYDAKAVKGVVPSVSRGWAPHAWVEINMDGTTRIFDPELSREIGRTLYKMTYKSAPLVYRKA